MPTISSAGVGSGIDVAGLVEQLVAAEAEPVQKRLDRKEAELQAGMSAMGAFKGAVAEFQASLGGLRDPQAFNAISTKLEDDDVVSVSAANQAMPGDYEIEVIQVAEAQKLASAAYESAGKFIGSGRLTLQFGSYESAQDRFQLNPAITPVTIDINSQNGSLYGIAEAINKSAAPLRAAVLNDGQGYRLVLSALEAGSQHSLRLLVSDDDGNDQDLQGLSALAYDPARPDGDGRNLYQTVAAQDALLRIDGIQISRASNSFDDVIAGLNITLKNNAAGKSTRLEVGLQTEQVVKSVQGFVEKYNEMIAAVNELTGYDPNTSVAGPLSGDASVRGVVNMIRRELGTDFSSINQRYGSLPAIGIDSGRDGLLSLNESRLRRAIETDRDEVMQLFARAGVATDPQVRFSQAQAQATAGNYALEITGLASQGRLLATAAPAGDLWLDDDNNELAVRIDGVASERLSLPVKQFRNPGQLAAELQSLLNADPHLSRNEIRARVEYRDGRLAISSERYGSASSVEVISLSPSLARLTGLSAMAGQMGEDVTGRFNDVAGTGSGRTLLGQGPASGIEIEVNGEQTGSRGAVLFSYGVAARMDELINGILRDDGMLSVRAEGFNARIDAIGRERERLNQRLAQSEDRYMKQFTAMDHMVGKMRSTSEYLSNQLANLPGPMQSGKSGRK